MRASPMRRFVFDACLPPLEVPLWSGIEVCIQQKAVYLSHAVCLLYKNVFYIEMNNSRYGVLSLGLSSNFRQDGCLHEQYIH